MGRNCGYAERFNRAYKVVFANFLSFCANSSTNFQRFIDYLPTIYRQGTLIFIFNMAHFQLSLSILISAQLALNKILFGNDYD